MSFSIKVNSHASLSLAGVFVHTTLEKAGRDCPHLWQHVFMPRMAQLNPLVASNAHSAKAYGVCVVTDMASGAFTYWAVVPHSKNILLPECMHSLHVPPGLYATGRVNTLEASGDVCEAFYSQWPSSQNMYVCVMEPSCFAFAGDVFTMPARIMPADVLKNTALVQNKMPYPAFSA